MDYVIINIQGRPVILPRSRFEQPEEPQETPLFDIILAVISLAVFLFVMYHVMVVLGQIILLIVTVIFEK